MSRCCASWTTSAGDVLDRRPAPERRRPPAHARVLPGGVRPGPRRLRGRAVHGADHEGHRRHAWKGKIALLEGDLETFGRLMNENHRLVNEMMRYCGFEQGAGEANNRIIAAGLSAGALGAKLTGAGGGGSVFMITRPARRRKWRPRCKSAGRLRLPRGQSLPAVGGRRGRSYPWAVTMIELPITVVVLAAGKAPAGPLRLATPRP